MSAGNLGSTQAASGSSVNDERAILYTEQEGDDNWRWNAESNLGSAVVVTYSFSGGGDLPSVYSSQKNPYGASSFSSFTTAEKAAFRSAAKDFMAASGVIMVEVDDGADIDIYNANGSSAGGWAWIPYITNSYQSDVDMVIDYNGSYAKGGYGYYLLLHELGHAMGLAHSHQDGGDAFVLNSAMDNTDNTVMSYSYAGAVSGLGSLDVAALQHLYGDSVVSRNWTFSETATNGVNATGSSGNDSLVAARAAGDTVVSFVAKGLGGNDNITGEAGVDWLYGNGGNDVLNGLNGNDSLFGGGGHDTVDGGNGHDHILVGRGTDFVDGGGGNDRIEGRRGWDTLNGEDGNDNIKGGGGLDTIDGGAGNDTIDGGRGADMLTGGAGADRFVFQSRSGADTITDFDTNADKLDFSATNFTYARVNVTATSNGALVEVGRVDIELLGVSVNEIGADDFIFS